MAVDAVERVPQARGHDDDRDEHREDPVDRRAGLAAKAEDVDEAERAGERELRRRRLERAARKRPAEGARPRARGCAESI
mgnify:CR=1 FL=1